MVACCLLLSAYCLLGLVVRIIGIDPGLEATGYGVIDVARGYRVVEAGVIRTTGRMGIAGRLWRLHEQVSEVLAEHRPEVAVLEELYAQYRHPVTAIKMGHARGVICLAVAQAGVSLIGYTAKRIRKAVTGNGNAGKEQVARMAAHWLGLRRVPTPTDVTDALAAAMGHALIVVGERAAA